MGCGFVALNERIGDFARSQNPPGDLAFARTDLEFSRCGLPPFRIKLRKDGAPSVFGLVKGGAPGVIE